MLCVKFRTTVNSVTTGAKLRVMCTCTFPLVMGRSAHTENNNMIQNAKYSMFSRTGVIFLTIVLSSFPALLHFNNLVLLLKTEYSTTEEAAELSKIYCDS